MGAVVTRTSVSATTQTDIHTAGGDESVVIRITNDQSSAVTINLSLSTTSVTQQAAGKLLPDGYTIDADTTLEIRGIVLTSTQKYLVLYASQAVNAVVMGWRD